MEIRRETSCYNARRYGKPWIAKIIIKDAKMEYQWGNWIGDAYNGSEGLLILNNIEPGEIYARGQRDNRKMSNSAPAFYVLGQDGKGTAVTKAEAYKILTSPTVVSTPTTPISGIGIGA